MKVRSLSEALGVELVDFDITQPCSPEEQAELRGLFAEHHLLFVHADGAADEDQDRFVSYFGPIQPMPNDELAFYITNDNNPNALLWHSDGAYGPRPGIGTSLWARHLAPGSAPTKFANAARALANLPTELRTRVDSKTIINMTDTGVLRTHTRRRVTDITPDAEPGRFRRHEHPIAYPLPHLDQKAIIANELMTTHVVGLSLEESDALLDEIFALLYADDNTYTHDWRVDDMIIWDNIALQHCRPRDGADVPRRLRRQSIDGWYTADGVLDWRAPLAEYDELEPDADLA